MTETTNILFIGDVVGKPGRKAIADHLPKLKDKYKLDFTVINAENAAGGYGITHKIVKELFEYGADVLTLGDHAWDKPEADEIVANNHKVIRPINYPKGTPGKGFNIYTTDKGVKIGVTNILGRTFMSCNPDCPFQASKALQQDYRLGTDYDIMIVDSHTEATSEAVCLGEYWDGKASMVVGSHTHIPTADAFIKPRGTLYQTDTGMTGVYNTSLGSDFDGALKRFETARRHKLTLSDGEGTLCGIYAKIDNNTGKCLEFKMIRTGGVLPNTEV